MLLHCNRQPPFYIDPFDNVIKATLRHPLIVARIALLNSRCFRLVEQPFPRVLANGCQHKKARCAVALPFVQETFIEQRTEQIPGVERGVVSVLLFVMQERFGSSQSAATDKEGKATKGALFGAGEKLIAPIECCVQGALASRLAARQGCPFSCQQPNAWLPRGGDKASQQGIRCQEPTTRRHQFDGQG